MDDMKAKDKDEISIVQNLQFAVKDLEKVDDDYCPEGFDDVESYLADLRETYEYDLQAEEDNREAAIEDKKFVAGEQWDPVVLEQRAGLPCLTINTIPQFTAQLVGDWRENRNSVKVVPAEAGDKAVADIRSGLIRAIESNSSAKRAYDNAFESAVQCGDGAFEIGVRYASDDVFDQDIVVNAIDDALSVVWDRLSVDPTGADATHCFVDDYIPEKDFKVQWPEADPSVLSPTETRMLRGTGWLDSGVVRVTSHWRLLERQKALVLFQDGMMKFIDDLEPEKVELLIAQHGPIQKSRLAPCRYAQMHLVTGFQILAGPFEYKLNRLPVIRVSGRTVTIGDKRIRYGLVRYMKDSVRLRNFWRSIAAEQMGYSPKAQWIGPESAFEGREEAFRKAHMSRDPLLIYNDDASVPPTRIDPPQIQSAFLNESQINVQDMKDVTGIHDASLGIKSNETSGKAINARQREGDVASLTYYDNGNAAVYEGGKVINQLIGQIYDATRIVRIVGADESTKLVKINDEHDPESPNVALGKYDVVIDTGPSYTTRRVEAAQSMMDAIQVFPDLMAVAGDLIVKAQDWPGAEELSERLKKTIPQHLLSEKELMEAQQQGQNDITAAIQQQAQQQIAAIEEQMAVAIQELQKLQAENVGMKNDVEIERQKLVIEEYKAETDRIKVLAELTGQIDQFNLDKLTAAASQGMAAEAAEARGQKPSSSGGVNPTTE
jgi:hypothetical protein